MLSQSSQSYARRKRFSILGLTMIIVVIPFCLYYLFFVSSKTTYFSNRNFRVVAQIGDHMISKIDNLAINLVNVAKQADESNKTKIEGNDTFVVPSMNPAPLNENDETKLKRKSQGDIKKVETKQADKLLDDVKKAASLVPDFDHLQYERVETARSKDCSAAGAGKNATRSTSDTKAVSSGSTRGGQRPAAAASSPTDSELVTLSVQPEKGSFWLSLEYKSDSCALPGKFSVKSDLSTLFEPFVSRYVIEERNETKERLFDEVLVAEQQTGRVIFEQGPAGLNVVNLNNLLINKDGKPALNLADQSSSLVDIQVAGASHKLFLQPIGLTLSATTDRNKQEVRWVVCGLTRNDHLREETFAVSYTLLITFVFAVLLAVLSWPLLKLKLMGPKDRLRRFDFGLTMFSGLMGTALVTFILLDVHTYLSLNYAIDENIKKLSNTIRSNFREELIDALEELRQLNKEIMTAKPAENRATSSISTRRNSSEPKSIDSSSSSFFWRPEILADYVDWKADPYPYFNNATWTDPKGQQRIKWTTRTDTTTFVDVAQRQFFKDARDDNTWELKDNGQDYQYSFQLINSRNTGENVAIIATSVPGSHWVSTLDTRLISLIGPVLPLGYGFAVIDSSGRVIFHSDEVKNLEEQFFSECENNRWLRAEVYARTDKLIDADYLGKGHRLYVSPIADTPWTLVTFVDKRMARTINLEVITLSFLLYLLFALLVLAAISLISLPRMIHVFSGRYFRTQRDGIRWLWPNPDRALHYKLLIVSYGLIASIFLLILRVGSEWFLLGCCVLLSFLAAGLWWLIAVWEPAVDAVEDGSLASLFARGLASLRKVCRKLYAKTLAGLGRVAKDRLSYRTPYAIAFALLLSLVSVLPAAAFFKIAHNFEMRLMVKHGQIGMAKALERRTQRVAEQYASIKFGNQANDRQGQSSPPDPLDRKKAFLQQRLEPSLNNRNRDVYDTCFFGTVRVDFPEKQYEERPGLLGRLYLEEIRPLYNQSCIESQGLAAGGSSDKLWRWKRDRDNHIFFWKGKDGRPDEKSVSLMSSIPAIVAPNTFWGWLRLILSMALVLLLPYVLVRFVARRFFLLDTDLPQSIDLSRATALTGSYVLIRSPMSGNETKWDCGKYCVTDLREVNDWPKWKEEVKSEATGLPAVLLNFEYCSDNPAANREKLLAIEHLLFKSKRCVVVVSTVCPLSFSLTPKPAGQVSTNSGSLETVPSEPLAIEGKQNGAADLKIEYHSFVPFSVAIKEKQNGTADVNAQAPVPEPPLTDLHARWTELFTNFATVYAVEKSSAEFVQDRPGFVSVLKTKVPSRYIEAIGNWIGIVQSGTLLEENGGDRAKIQELISEVVEQAHAYHQAVWDTCTEGQRCTLIQLAQSGMISPQNKHLRLLVKRGLVVRDQGLRLMDESFRLFVSSVSHKQDIEAWRQQDGGSAWELLKTPLLLILVSVALFLFITQKDFYDSTISLVSAITGALALLFRLLGMFHGKDKGAGAMQS
jgi:hypothetical protein